MLYQANYPVTKEFILKRLTQEQIFEKYLGVEAQTHRQFCNPLRKDRNPTCNFSYHNGKLRFKDWAWPGKPLDCFDIVMKIYNLSFDQAMKRIASDFGLTNTTENSDAIERFKKLKAGTGKSTRTQIRVRISEFTEQDKQYLRMHGVTGKQCSKFDVRPIDRVWVRGNLVWGYHPEDPAIGYYFGTDDEDIQLWKIYYYKRPNSPRFICNTSRLQGYDQLPESAAGLVITKSLKDVMALDRFGIPAIAPQGEAHLMKKETINELKDRFDIIRTLFDFDLAGVKAAKYIRNRYSIQPLFLGDGRFGTEHFEAKDFSDFVKYNNIQQARGLVYRILNELSINRDAIIKSRTPHNRAVAYEKR